MDLKQYLEPADGIQCDHPRVRELALGAAKGADNDIQKARLLFNYARDSIRYNPYCPFDRMEDYLALNTLARGQGFCVQKSAFLVTLARSLGIPARMGFANIINHQLPEGLESMLGSRRMAHHCFVEWLVGGKWLKSTPSFERELCRQKGWALVEFDPEKDGKFFELDLNGRPHISYEQYLGSSPGVPLDDILAHWSEEYGADRVESWKEQSAGQREAYGQ